MAWKLPWQSTPESSPSEPVKKRVSSPRAPREATVPKAIYEQMCRQYEQHIADLRAQVAQQQQLIQTLSDDKYFKPDLVKRPPAPSEPYRPQFSADSMNDQPNFDAAADSEQVQAQDRVSEELEKEFYSLAEDHEQWRRDHAPPT